MGIGLLSWGSRLVSFIPGGQIFGIVGAIGSALAAFVRAVIEGITVAIANPVVFIIVGLGFAGGLVEGWRMQAKRVEVARAQAAKERARVEAIIADANSHVEAARALAEEARKWAPRPTTSAEVIALCARSASCRERGK